MTFLTGVALIITGIIYIVVQVTSVRIHLLSMIIFRKKKKKRTNL
jgi:hypothetical protein